MKIILTENQIERLIDLYEIDREELGKGAFHNVFTTKFSGNYSLNNQDVVVKLGPLYSVKQFSKEFKKFPDLFPIVYKSGMIKDKDYGYMYIEKLNVNKFINNIKKLINDNWFSDGEIFRLLSNADIRYKNKFSKSGDDGGLDVFQKKYEHFIQNSDDELVDFFNQLYELIIKIHDLFDSGIISNGKKFIDLHIQNFGIDKNNKVKCLDF